jgi:hypothetical protein
MSVFEGGDGSTRGGRSERSRESGDLVPDDALDRCGEGAVGCIVASICVWARGMFLLNCLCKLLLLLLLVSVESKRDRPKSYINIRLPTAMQRANFRKQCIWGGSARLRQVENLRPHQPRASSMSRCTRANSGHLGICTACPSTPQRTVHTGDIGPRRIAQTFSPYAQRKRRWSYAPR